MHPVPSTGTVEAKQHTQQVKGGITFAVQQDVEQLVPTRASCCFSPPSKRSLAFDLWLESALLIGLGKSWQQCLKRFPVESCHCPQQAVLIKNAV